ncbi:MAG: hypothetical protein QOF76_3214 [Solirubrobacteraceae bacterium]|nr:hypothetical protein [Solirubrobacteraceae bacterium]
MIYLAYVRWESQPQSDLSDKMVSMARMTATETSRQFSDVLNRVAAGEEIEITRSGAPVAVITPPRVRTLSADQFRKLLREAPSVDEDFAADVRAAREAIEPPDATWPS